MSQRVLGVQMRWHLAVLALCEAIALAVAPYLAGRLFDGPALRLPAECWAGALGFAGATVVAMAALGMFSARQRARPMGMLIRIGLSVALGMAAVLIVARLTPVAFLMGQFPLAAVPVAFVLAATVHFTGREMFEGDLFKRRVLVFGTGNQASSVTQLRRRSDKRGFRLVGFVRPEGDPLVVDRASVLERSGRLMDFATAQQVDEIVVAMDDRRQNFPLADLLECRLSGIDVTELTTFLERETGKVRLDVLNPSWLIFGQGFRRNALRLTTERAFDVVTSLVLLALTWPIFLLTALLIKLEDGLKAPVIYRQTRVGFLGEHFDVLKFRSMRVDAEASGAQWAQQSDSRVTRVGSVIRKIRVDELPQIINVLRGDMSFVGPRPERPQFVEELSATIPYYEQRHCVKPGITGWAQLCYPYGASAKDAAEKLQYDLYYVKNHSLFFDIMVLIQTAEVILMRKGAR